MRGWVNYFKLAGYEESTKADRILTNGQRRKIRSLLETVEENLNEDSMISKYVIPKWEVQYGYAQLAVKAYCCASLIPTLYLFCM